MGKDKGSAPSPAAEKSAPNAGAGAPVSTDCLVKACKSKLSRFGFCSEHFDHFKFGLINKKGLPVSDYEKKFEQYTSHKTKKAPKVA